MRVNGINSYLYPPNIYPNKRYNYVSRVSLVVLIGLKRLLLPVFMMV